MSNENNEMRFEFGSNWNKFIKKHFSEERLEVARRRILDFMEREDLEGLDFLDIGCGSGLHSYGAFRSKAGKIHSFDYDPNSVKTTAMLRKHAGEPDNWHVERGDVLDDEYIASLGKWNFVYSWGVLHHTGEMWRAIRNAQSCVAEGGKFYIALYSADADFQPSKEFWLDVKKEYNQSSWLKKKYMAYWYVWRFGMQKDIKRLPEVLKQMFTYRFQRGMDYFADVHDWLGGWPMEYAPDQEVVDMMEQEHGFRMINADTGHACSEFYFERTGTPEKPTIVTEFIAAKRAAEAAAAEAAEAEGQEAELEAS